MAQIPTLFKNGLPQEFIFTIPKSSPGSYVTGTDEQTLDDALTADGITIDYVLKFRLAGGSWATISTPDITFDLDGLFWKGYIPAANLTTAKAGMNAQILLSSPTNAILPVSLNAVIGGSNSLQVLTITSHNSTTQQIPTGDTSITASRINKIQDLTTGMTLYDSTDPRHTAAFQNVAGPDITVVAGVITYLYDGSSIEDDDILRIEVNPELS